MAQCEPCIQTFLKNKIGGISGEIRKKKEKERKAKKTKQRERKKKEKWVFLFSIRYTKIGPSVFVGARGKVGPHNEGYAWVPKFGSFVKPQEVGNFPIWIIFSLKVI